MERPRRPHVDAALVALKDDLTTHGADVAGELAMDTVATRSVSAGEPPGSRSTVEQQEGTYHAGSA